MAESAVGELTPERVFRDYAPRVYNLARRMLGNDADAEDVTQDVLLKVVRKLDTFRGKSSLPTWLHRVTVNAALELRRSRARRPEVNTDAPLDGPAGRLGGRPQPGPDREAQDREAHALLERAIGGLPEGYRDAYVLSDVEGLPNQEAADLLGISQGAMKSRLHRARLMLRDAL